MGFDMFIKIFAVVVIGEFFSRFDCALGKYEYFFVSNIDFAVRDARMIDEACAVAWNVPVDHGCATRPK